MRALKRAQDSLLAQIIRTVQESLRARIPVQDLADKVSSVFVPSVIVLAVVTFLVWSIVLKDANLGLANAISVLIIACPCALGLATPTSSLVASGVGASHGILVRHPEAMQKLEKVNLLAVDKTGTLTQGKPSIAKVLSASNVTEKEVIQLAASLEQGSEHPLAKSVLKKALEMKVDLLEVSDFQYHVGRGLRGKVGNREICLGSPAFIVSQGISLNGLTSQIPGDLLEQSTILALAVAGQLSGLLLVEDKIKETSYLAINELSKQGIAVAMFTGDGAKRAESVARALGIKEYYPELLPQDKARLIRDYRARAYRVAMAGDGINDAPALSEADVGVALGDGSGVAVGSADIVLIKGDLMALTRALRLAKAMMRNIRQNLVCAFAYNALAIPIAAGVFIPVFNVALDPVLASAAMSLSSLSVVVNALRLRTLKL
jgi:Cu+-exporting ATPase